MDNKIILSNYEMNLFVVNLEEFLEYSGKFGYAIARNYRLLSETLYDYNNVKYDLLTKYGKDELDANGNPVGNKYLSPDDKNYSLVISKLSELDSIEHEVKIFTIPHDDLPDNLTARQIISIQWMLDE